MARTAMEAGRRRGAPRPAGRGRRLPIQTQRSRGLLLFAAPGIIIFALVTLMPSIQGVGYAFTDWDGLSPSSEFVGIRNIIRVFADPVSGAAVANTMLIAIAFTVFQNVFGLLLALGVTSQVRSRHLLRMAFFLPAILTPLVVAYLWRFLLSPEGQINEFLGFFGLGPFSWLGETGLALTSIMLVLVWQYVGYSMIIFVAGIEGIPDDVIEAAMVDGAGPVRRFWSITLPLLWPALTINVMLSMLAGLKLFDQVLALTSGGPGGSTHTLSTLLYLRAFGFGEVGRGVAMALVLAVLVAVVAVVQYLMLSRREIRG